MRSKRVQPILVLLFITTLSVVTACQTSPPPSTVTSIGSPPGSHPNFSQTLGETKCAIYADMLVLPFEEAILEADLVVKLSIEQALEELDSPTHKTLYEASVLNVVKGDKELTTIHVLQAGNSKCSFNDNPLFMPVEQYYLILNKASGNNPVERFYIQGEETGMYKVLEDGYIVKLAHRDSYLSDIIDTTLTSELQANYDEPIMVFTEQQFMDKVIQLLDE